MVELMMRRILRYGQGELSFLDILLDETLCQGELLIPKDMIRQSGSLNRYLPAKHKYELVLRIAHDTSVFFEEIEEEEAEKLLSQNEVLVLQEEETSENGWQTDCYIVGKYSKILQEADLFDVVIASLLEEADKQGYYEQIIGFLEQMLVQGELYHKIDSDTAPILIYKGDTVCHNVLTFFAEQFGEALRNRGERVEYFDVSKEDLSNVARYVGRHYKAVVGVQTYMFGLKMGDGTEVHSKIYGPKFNFVFDHPIWARTYMKHTFSDFYVLTHDSNYVNFFEKYYKKNALLFPPAGYRDNASWNEAERIYDLSFVGACGDYLHELRLIHEMDREKRFLANHFLLIMKKNPMLTAEDAFAIMLEERNLELNEEQFFELFYELRRVIYCIAHYYRHKVVKTILDAGIELHVFGSSWKNSTLAKCENLICHEDVTIEESMEVWCKSKLSLNVMSWHKDGFTERIANIMLSGAVLVTDETECIKAEYGKNVLTFRLDELEKLTEQVKSVLKDDTRRQVITEVARSCTEANHTWDKRAEQFVEMLSFL